MPEWQPIPLPTGLEEAKSKTASSGFLENCYPEQNPEGSPSPFTLYNRPGLSLWSAIGDGPIRGMIMMPPDLYVVSGDELYAVVPLSKAATLLGNIGGNGTVRMIQNGAHVGIATSSPAYAASRSAGVLSLAQQNFSGAAYQDGYGIFPRYGTQDFFITAVDDMTSIAALDFSAADAYADSLVGCIVDHLQLHLLGTDHIEIWSNAGLADFPFARQGVVERGVVSGDSAVKFDSFVYFLSKDLDVLRLDGYNPQKISTPWVDRLIANTADQKSAKGFYFRIGGRTFYILAFSDLTLCYDATANTWQKWSTYGLDRWRGQNYVYYEGLHLVGDYANGNIYELDLDTYTDNGTAIQRRLTFASLEAAQDWIFQYGFRLSMETGVGLALGQGSNPLAMLEWSDNGGKTFQGGIEASIGAIGEYESAVQWNRLGRFKRRILRVTISDPVKTAINGAYGLLAKGSGGAHRQ